MGRSLYDYFVIGLKGFAMGAANVIPGVSGGTIALITGIYVEFINTLKKFDLKALKLLFSFKIKELLVHINFNFIASLGLGILVSLFSIAKLFEYLFEHHPIYIWSFFFGLILASVYFVGRTVTQWRGTTVAALLVGAAIAIGISLLSQVSESDNLFYVFICGVIGISGMMLPGLSGSFILIIMGNYQLLMVESIADFNVLLLTVFVIGSVAGMISFSHVLSWILKHYFNVTIALLTGFVFGSLSIIWPWKEEVEWIVKGDGERVPIKYKHLMPESFDTQTMIAIGLMILGILSIYLIEKVAKKPEPAE